MNLKEKIAQLLVEIGWEGIVIEAYFNPFYRPDHPEDKKYIFRTQMHAPLDLETLVHYAIDLGFIEGHKYATVLAAIEGVLAAAIRALSNGRSINLGGFVNIQTVMSGASNDPNAKFTDIENASIRINFVTGVAVQKAIKKVGVINHGLADASYSLDRVVCTYSGSETHFYPQADIVLTGKNIKIAPFEDETTGLFFVNNATGQESRLPCNHSLNEPSKVITLAPEDITNGEYTIQIRTRFSCGSTRLLNATRIIPYGIPVTVSTTGKEDAKRLMEQKKEEERQKQKATGKADANVKAKQAEKKK